MRLIATLENEQDVNAISQSLKREEIEFQLDPERNTDWGSSDYGTVQYKLWIIDEDQVDKALNILDKYNANPKDPYFASQETALKTVRISPKETFKQIPTKIVNLGRRSRKPDVSAVGPFTFYILMLCIALFIIEGFTQPNKWPVPSSLPLAELYASPIQRNLLFDYPLPYELFNKFVEKFTPEKVLNPQELPPEAENQLAQILSMPYWEGLYDRIVNVLKDPNTPFWPDVPLFTKIKQGELWRLITPAFLHGNVFHILFNMLWLYALGRQLEQKLGAVRYLFFILLTGVITNIAQYMMTGSNFIGFSGILCAMITFIMARQVLAAWEGYRLDKMTKIFILVFIFGIFAFQLVSFVFEVTTHVSFASGIANTAHLVGLACGALLGRISFFAWK